MITEATTTLKNFEVKAVWEAIVNEKIFRQAEALLKKNSERLGRIWSKNFTYLLSGLMICGKCGERLQGKSAYSELSKKYYYYSHKNTCKENGINRIPADETHNLVLDWLKDISSNDKKFAELKEQGKIRINQRLKELAVSLSELEVGQAHIEKELEGRVSELVRVKAESVKTVIETSILKLEAGKKESSERIAYVQNEIKELREMVKSEKGMYEEYRKPIISALSDGVGSSLKERLKKLITFVRIEEKGIKIALYSVNRKGPFCKRYVTAPSNILITNGKNQDWKYLIMEEISLPGHLLLKNRSYISGLYLKEKLAKREIARRLNISHSAVIQVLDRAGVNKALPASPDHRKGQIPFGFDCIDSRLVKNAQEQEAIRILRQMTLTGLSLRACAREMNKRLISAKNNGIWQANTVKKILDRVN